MNKTFHANRIKYNACVGFNGNYDMADYALGYLESVESLFESTIKLKTTLDVIIYPILYSARHYIELMLKHQLKLLTYINQIVHTRFKYQIITKHNISWLWSEFKKLSEVDSRYIDLIQKANEYIEDFSEIDDNGETFRYPHSKDNNKHLGQLSCIDIIDFHSRFKELSDILTEIGFLTNNLIREYNQRSFLCKKSREEIKAIAKALPPVKDWNDPNFKDIKAKIMHDFSLSSNQLSKIVSFIKSHREFSSLIDNEIKIEELSIEDLMWFLKEYNYYMSKPMNKYIEFLNECISHIERRLSKKAIASIAQLYDMGYFRMYSEEYDRGFEYKMLETKSELIRMYLLTNTIVKEQIKYGLISMGQKSLLKAFD